MGNLLLRCGILLSILGWLAFAEPAKNGGLLSVAATNAEHERPQLVFNAHRYEYQPPAGTKIRRDVEYARRGSRALCLDIYLPAGVADGCPTVMWIPDGAWRCGTRERPDALPLLEHGFAVVCIEYRSSDEAIFPAQWDDCRAAVEWIRQHGHEFRLDPERLAAWGESAGGHLATLLGVKSSSPSDSLQAVIEFSAPIDFLLLDEQLSHLARPAIRHADPFSPVSLLLGASIVDCPDRVREANPLTYITAGQPLSKFLILHGKEDDIVPAAQGQMLHRAVLDAGGEAEFQETGLIGHHRQMSPDVIPIVAGFLREALR